MILSWIKNTYKQVFELASLKKKQRQFAWLLTFCIWIISLINSFSRESLTLFFIGLIPLVLSFVYPSIFKLLLISWLFLGKVLGEITSTLILFIIYFFVFFPITFFKRIFKKQPIISGWIKRENPEVDYEKLY